MSISIEELKELVNNEYHVRLIILDDGTIEKAYPTYKDKLIEICTDKLGVTKEAIYTLCPEEYKSNFLLWLCTLSGSIITENYMYLGEPNKNQLETIEAIKNYCFN